MGLLRKALLLIALSFAFIPGEAFAVCTGQFLGGTLCGNNTASQAIPGPTANPVLGVPGTNTGSMGFAGSGSGTATVSAQSVAGTPSLLLPTASGTLSSTATAPLVLNAVTGAMSLQGATGSVVVGSGGTGSLFTPNPVLGVAGSVVGSLGFQNATSGTVTLQPVTGALGATTILIPNTAGTLADGASSPLVLNASTGNLTCPTCVTSSGGGAITGTAPIVVSAAGVVSLQGATGSVAVGSGGTGSSFTPTPVLGVAGSTVGSIGFQNATSGTETITPATGALGSGVATLPAGTYIIVGDTLTQTLSGKTLTSPTINSGALSGTFSGNATLSGNITHSGQLIETGTSAPASAGGQTVIMGTIAVPTLTNTGQAFFYNTVAGGAVIQGDGSGTDFSLLNKSGATVCSVTTGTQTLGCNTLSLTNALSIANGGTGQTSASAAFNALAPTAVRAGDIIYWNGSTYTTLAGNNSGTQILTENASGVPSWAAAGSVSSVSITASGGLTTSGTCTITTSGTCNIIGQPTITVSTVTATSHTGGFGANSSGTYTTPAGARAIKITMVGGGGGGTGSGSGAGASGTGGNTCWNTSGAACTSPVLQASGGFGTSSSGQVSGGSGGAGSSGSTTCNLFAQAGQGGSGGDNLTTSGIGKLGGNSSLFGGGGPAVAGGGNPGIAGVTNSGGGGSGASGASVVGGAGGGAGGTCIHYITTPAGTYTYAVGAAGTAGGAGTSGTTGGAGAAGQIFVEEEY